MKYCLTIIAVLIHSSSLLAWDQSDLAYLSSDKFLIRQLPDLTNLSWKVGAFQERALIKSGLKLGSLKSWVDREEGPSVWILNELKVIFKKKKFIEVLIERKTGKILKYIVDGKDETPPDVTKLSECDVLEEVKAKIKVPAGEYITDRTVAKCDEDIMAIWTNDKEVNMGGFIRLAGLDEDADPQKPKYKAELVKFGQKQ